MLTDDELWAMEEYISSKYHIDSEEAAKLLADLHRYRIWCLRLVACQDANDGEGDLFALADLTKDVRAALEDKL